VLITNKFRDIYLKIIQTVQSSFVCNRSLYFFRVPRVVCGPHFRLLVPWATRLLSQWMLRWWRVNGSTARELFSCTHPSTPNERLDRPLVGYSWQSQWFLFATKKRYYTAVYLMFLQLPIHCKTISLWQNCYTICYEWYNTK